MHALPIYWNYKCVSFAQVGHDAVEIPLSTFCEQNMGYNRYIDDPI